MKRDLLTALRMTLATTLLLGVVYPLVVTGLAQAMFPPQANGSLVRKDGDVVGSALIGQPFSGPKYFHPRPSAALYDGVASGGTNLGPTNRKLVERVMGEVERRAKENPGRAVPVDLVTASGSGLDPHITPAAAEHQVPRVARARGVPEGQIRRLVSSMTEGRQLGVLGEPRVNLLLLNLELDRAMR